jgi:hypothetical protein
MCEQERQQQGYMEEDGHTKQQQVTTVDSKALTSSECTHEGAGPTSLRVRHMCEQERQQQGYMEGDRRTQNSNK